METPFEIVLKKCGWCNIEKPIDCFAIRKKNGKETLRNECRDCSCKRRRKLYDTVNRDKILKRNKEYINKRKEYKKEYDRNREQKLRGERSKRNLAEYHRRKDTDINFRIKRAMRARIYFAVRDGKKGDKTENLVGCTVIELKKHLESLFVDGMGWDNFGLKGWHIDHKKPCDAFDFTDTEQQKACFHYTNLQPLWWYDNLAKGAQIIDYGKD